MAGESWRSLTLNDCASFVSGGTPSKSRADFWSGSIPWISAKDLKVFRLYDAEDHVTHDAVRAGSRLAPAGSIFLLVRGMTLHNDVPICVAMREMAFNQDIKALMPKAGVDAAFLTYWLLFQKPVLLSSVDSAGHGTGRLNTDTLKSMRVALPPLAEQKRIAEVLGALDDKIELNRRMNATLEATARALFQSWFVDFDPVRAKLDARTPSGMDAATAALFPDSFEESSLGHIPKGWVVKTAEEISAVGIGKTPPRKEHHWFSENPADVPWMSIRDLGEAGVFISKTSEFLTSEAVEKFRVRRIPNDTVVLSFKLTMGRVAITDGEMLSNEAIAHFRLNPETPFGSAYLYCYLKGFGFDQLGNTSSIATAINSDMVRGIKVLLPSKSVGDAFENTVAPIFAQIKSLSRESRTLAALRDTLLPKLLGGEFKNETSNK
jgi:type I restriction enzyme S subunit